MIKDQRGASLIGAVVAMGMLILLLLLVLNSTTDNFLLKNMNAEAERDLDYSLNSLSKALVHTSGLSEDTLIQVDNYLNVIDLDKPSSLYLKPIYTEGGLVTDGKRFDIVDSKIVSNVSINLAMSEEDKLFGNTTGQMATVTYGFKSNELAKYTLYEGETTTMHPYIRYTPSHVVGLNLSYSTLVPKSVDDDNLRLKVPVPVEGGAMIGGTYRAQ